VSKLLHQAVKSAKPYVLAQGFQPARVEHRPGQSALIYFTNGDSSTAVCLHCPDTPCMILREGEADSTSLVSFPAEKTPQLCAAGAMSIKLDEGVPQIDHERCIGCGICASRCPAGAIFLSAEKGADVLPHHSITPAFRAGQGPDDPAFQETFTALANAEHVGVLAEESDDLVDRTSEKIKLARRNMGDRFPVHHTRNLFIALGQGASMRRKGNNHMRMDLLLGPPGIERGVVEVEFGQQAALDAPRDILDALAVLQSRYKWPLDTIVPILVTDELPNKRSGFWEVIRDIRDITGVRIATATTLALHMMLWARMSPGSYDIFHVHKDSDSYRTMVLEALMGRALKLGSDLKPSIECAK
jgi:Fe-S-cluster-containing hydrogenase component 2